jgi:hypothetical protein
MKKLIGLMLATVVASVILGALALPAMAGPQNVGGVVVGSGDAPDCVGGSCGGVIVEDPAGRGPNCDGGNCGGSVCEGTDCGSCAGGNCGGSISGPGEAKDKDKDKDKDRDKEAAKPRALPRTGNTIPLAATVALGAGMLLVGAFFTFVAHPSTKLAMSMVSYRPRRRL